jgi:hypothetical protein
MSDLDGRCFVKRGLTLVPADFAAEEMLADIEDGKEIILSARQARNPQHHRWFFALMHKVCANTDDWHDEEELLDAIKLATGHVQRRMKLDGTMYQAPRSISFASMGQDKFKRFVDRALYVLSKALGFDAETLMAEVDRTQKREAA